MLLLIIDYHKITNGSSLSLFTGCTLEKQNILQKTFGTSGTLTRRQIGVGDGFMRVCERETDSSKKPTEKNV